MKEFQSLIWLAYKVITNGVHAINDKKLKK